MAIKFPPRDAAGTDLQNKINAAQTAVNAAPAATVVQLTQSLDALQRSAVRHAIASGLRTADAILASYTVPAGDAYGQDLNTTITSLATQITTASTKNPALVPSLQQQRAAAQVALLEHLMDGGRASSAGATAAAILANA